MFPPPRLRALVIVVLTGGCLPSCRDHKQTVQADLEEAGFRITAEDWFRASAENNAEAMKRFIAAGFSPAMKDAAGDTALHTAAAAGAEGAADYLLKQAVPIDVKGAKERTPLMAAVLADKRGMIAWLLRQGADPKLKDVEHFSALQLAVREGKTSSAEELARVDGDLDSALMLASLLGHAEVIDALTKYGASVYARMDGDRTPLMLAAQNGHPEAVKLLLDLGSSRLAVNGKGKNAAQLAEEAGHPEIAAMINHEAAQKELAFDSPTQISEKMDHFAAANEGEPSEKAIKQISRPIEGAVLGGTGKAPLIMRYYRESDVPVEVARVDHETATLRISGAAPHEVTVKTGEVIPGSRLLLVQVKKRLEVSKVAGEKGLEVSVVELADRTSGVKREWISGRQSTSHDPIALVEDPATGARYTATQGQRFKSADGSEFRITDVRPGQIVIEDLSDGTVQTVRLRGPRG